MELPDDFCLGTIPPPAGERDAVDSESYESVAHDSGAQCIVLAL